MLDLPKHPLNILVIGNGGREHALVWKLAQSPLVGQIFCAPGNGGTAHAQKSKNIDIKIDQFEKLAQFCLDSKIDLTVVGPDNALADGIVDHFQNKNLRIFGPTQAASKLEWSKSYAKDFMARHKIPTAKFSTVTEYGQAKTFVQKNDWAQVIKVDGLALGKGVYVCQDKEEALAALADIFQDKKFGQAGETVVMEEKLNGQEISLFLLCDGKNYLPLGTAQDNKRRFDNNQGPNTGGMGAISPAPIYNQYKDLIQTTIIEPLIAALKFENLDYRGVLYLGILLNENKTSKQIEPQVLEFNARFGDPETQAVLLRLRSDLLPALWACTEQKLDQTKLDWTKQASCCVVAVAKTYPEKGSSGEAIDLSSAYPSEQSVIFHAGTKLINNDLVTAGGRVLAISALGDTLEQAANNAYSLLGKIKFESIDYRQDIGRLPSEIVRTH